MPLGRWVDDREALYRLVGDAQKYLHDAEGMRREGEIKSRAGWKGWGGVPRVIDARWNMLSLVCKGCEREYI